MPRPAPTATALERALDSERRAGPLDALHAARRIWLAEQRIDMGRLASELRISRATLYNWVGDRERLTAEVLWSLAKDTIAQARDAARGVGADYVTAIIDFYLTALATFTPVRSFITRDPEFALRVLTGTRTPFQRRLITAVRELIDEQVAAAGYDPPLDPETLAYVLVRVGESFIFNDAITGAEPDLGKAIQASSVLLHAAAVA